MLKGRLCLFIIWVPGCSRFLKLGLYNHGASCFIYTPVAEAIFLCILYVDRFGLLLVANVPVNVEVDATSNAAVGIARAFSFIASEKDPRQAFDWLLQVRRWF